jgi:FAD/FMN-containing dehydrogenase
MLFDRRTFLQLTAITAMPSCSSRRDAPTVALPRRQLVGPDDLRYDAARAGHNARVSVHPRAIFFAQSTDDVAAAVAWARAHTVELSIRSGRHSYEGYSAVEGGLIVDVSAMADVQYDARTGRVDVGAGSTLLPLHEELALAGVTIPTGSCASVGIAGSALGGGLGLLGRCFGLTCDRLVGAEMVTADGDVLGASERDHPDLFWALRGGGGGNFGVVTRLAFQTCAVTDPVTAFSLDWATTGADRFRSVVNAWQEWAPFVDDRLTSTLLLGQGWAHANGLFLGPADQLPQLLGPVVGALEPARMSMEPLPYIRSARRFAEVDETSRYVPMPPTPGRATKHSSAFVYDNLPLEAIDLLGAALAEPGVHGLVHLDALGGAVSRTPPEATAFVHRRARYSVQYQADLGDGDEAPQGIAWVRRLRRALAPYTRGAYVNYIDSDLEASGVAYYGANLPRLRAVKTMYDPQNVFHFAQSVRPA